MTHGGPNAGNRSVAVAFMGGGFLAHADYAGLVAGLLPELPQRTLARLFKKFGVITGVSGGSWFSSQLIYSSKFRQMIYQAAGAPPLASVTFNTMYYAPVLDPLRGTSVAGARQGVAECLGELRPLVTLQEAAARSAAGEQQPQIPISAQYIPWYLEILSELYILIQAGGVSWEDLVQQMFSRGAGIDPTLPLGTARANAWAKGKLFLQGVTAASPSATAEAFTTDPNLTRVTLYETQSGGVQLSYAASAPPTPADGAPLAATTPAKFSVLVGAGEEQSSPLPFCRTSDCFSISLDYEFTPPNGATTQQRVSLGSVFQSAFEADAGKVPVSSASAASSAFEGITAVQTGLGGKQGCLSLAVWASGAPSGRSFTTANDLRTEMFSGVALSTDLASRVVGDAIQPLLDGGLVESSGVAMAVAAGAVEVLAVINIGRGSQTLASLLSVFSGGGSPQSRVFDSPNTDQFQASFAAFPRIPAAQGSKFLQSIIYGSVQCVTRENPWFGITPDRPVTLNVIAIQTDNITIGLIEEGFSYNSFFNFGTLAGEVVQTLTGAESRAHTRSILQQFFL